MLNSKIPYKYEPGLKGIFVANFIVASNICIVINNELTPAQKI
ncbi:MAG: hypothetical protein PWQ06_2114 [Anaerophaga sp.]|nr:hypothetical protein [Anaerophaga sp.]